MTADHRLALSCKVGKLEQRLWISTCTYFWIDTHTLFRSRGSLHCSSVRAIPSRFISSCCGYSCSSSCLATMSIRMTRTLETPGQLRFRHSTSLCNCQSTVWSMLAMSPPHPACPFETGVGIVSAFHHVHCTLGAPALYWSVGWSYAANSLEF